MFCATPTMLRMRFRRRSWCWHCGGVRSGSATHWRAGSMGWRGGCRAARRPRQFAGAPASNVAQRLTVEAYEPSADRPDLRVLYEELDRLPPRYREPVVLCDLEGLSHEAAAVRLGCAVSTVGVRRRRARRKLRERLTRAALRSAQERPSRISRCKGLRPPSRRRWRGQRSRRCGARWVQGRSPGRSRRR